MSILKEKLKGSIVALVTPFDEIGMVDYDKFKELIKFQIDNKTDGICILGTTGESSTLTYEEKKKLISIASQICKNKITLIIGITSNNTKEALNEAYDFSRIGGDYLLVLTPYYNKTNKSGLLKHYKMIEDVSSCPIIIYNVPSRTGLSVPFDVLSELSKHKNIVGIKEASGDLKYVEEISKLICDDFVLLCGDELKLKEYIEYKSTGVISVFGNIAPRYMKRMLEFYLENSKLSSLIETLFIEVNPIPIKEAMNLLGYQVGDYRLPLDNMNDENRNILIDNINICKGLIR